MGSEERLAALAAGGAAAAVEVAAAVAGVGVGKINTKLVAEGDNLPFAEVDEGTQDFQLGVGAKADGAGHGLHEVLPAIGVDGVIPGVGGDDNARGAVAFRNASGHGQKDAVAEGNDGLFHVFRGVVFRGDGIGTAQQGAVQVRGNGGDVNLMVGDAEMFRLPAGAGEFMAGVVAAVVKCQGSGYLVVPAGPMESGGGIQPAGEENRDIHGSEGAVFRLVFGDGGELDAAAGAKAAFHFHPHRGDGRHQVIQDAVDDLLIESRVVAVGDEVIFQALGFHNFLSRAVGDGQVAAVRLPGDGAEGGELVRVEHDGIAPLRAAVRERFQLCFIR